MENVKMRCALYGRIMLKSIVLLTLLPEFGRYSWVNAFVIVFYLVLAVMLIDIGVSIKKRDVKKKYITYTCLIIGQIIIVQIVSAITNVATVNTWLAAVGVNALFITIVIILLDVARSIKHTNELVVGILRFIVFLIVTLLLISNLAFFLGV